MKRTQGRLWLCGSLLVLNLVFIWGNSLMPGELSKAFSQWVGSLLGLLGDASGELGQGHGLLRKLAHFSEFACLGLLLTWHCSMLGRKPWHPLLCGFLVACTDETIQCFIPERGPAVRDVAIDTAGVALGIAALLAGYTIYQKRKNKKILEETTT